MSFTTEKTFNVRVTVSFFLVMLGFLSCILRIAVIMSGNYSEAQVKQSSYRVEIGGIRGTIFDCNRIPITNSKSITVAAIVPSPSKKEWLLDAIKEENKQTFLKKLESDTPFVFELERDIKLQGVLTTKYYKHTLEEMSFCHIVGYIDGDYKGLTGLEKAYDDLLYSTDKASALFKTDGRGGVLKGEEITIENDTSKIASGVVTCLDINIQKAVDKATENMKKGAAVVADIKTGKIKAMVSRPYYDVNDVSVFLQREDSPLINRCLSVYNVGSAFKPCVAAAALEANTGNYSINCTGYEIIADRKFACHKKDGHLLMDMKSAICQSCNVFFYNLAAKIGADNLYNMAANLGFGNKIKLAKGIYSTGGNLTQRELLSNSAELANLSIGQGKLLLSPVSMLTLYCAIGNKGCYTLPSVVEGTLEEGVFTACKSNSPTRVMSEENAKKLSDYLKGVVTDGTGKAANPKNTTAAGKTATAQTGRYKNGTEITHSWFCGFFPAEKPKYAVCVIVEEGTGSAEIFSKIADLITEQYPDK